MPAQGKLGPLQVRREPDSARLLADHTGHDQPDSWNSALFQGARRAGCPGLRQVTSIRLPVLGMHCAATRNSPPLGHLADSLPRGTTGDTDSYPGVLDRVLEDRFVSTGELAGMTRLAAEPGLTRSTAQHAHRHYLQQVAAAAWRDGQVTQARPSVDAIGRSAA